MKTNLWLTVLTIALVLNMFMMRTNVDGADPGIRKEHLDHTPGHFVDNETIEIGENGLQVSSDFAMGSNGSATTVTTVVSQGQTNVDVAATQAATDGFFICVVNNSLNDGKSACAIGYTDSNSTPTTILGYATVGDYNGAKILNSSFCIPVKKGDYYKAEWYGIYSSSKQATRTYYFKPYGL